MWQLECYFPSGTDKCMWQALFSVPFLIVTILTLTLNITLTPSTTPNPINTKTNLNPNPQNPNHNLTPRTENSMEQIQLSVLGDGKYHLCIIFRPGRTNIHDRRYLPSMGSKIIYAYGLHISAADSSRIIRIRRHSTSWLLYTAVNSLQIRRINRTHL